MTASRCIETEKRVKRFPAPSRITPLCRLCRTGSSVCTPTSCASPQPSSHQSQAVQPYAKISLLFACSPASATILFAFRITTRPTALNICTRSRIESRSPRVEVINLLTEPYLTYAHPPTPRRQMLSLLPIIRPQRDLHWYASGAGLARQIGTVVALGMPSSKGKLVALHSTQ
ncbi:hypothetical protein BKA81DRAFT_224889 [Phyllosticta paracitricarpa]